ncbi:MAG TPA: hypothetical protein DIU00_18870 [Phycisphaerales bacterium]|nr:hypothetical protein [Phycisphaerales bacterium]
MKYSSLERNHVILPNRLRDLIQFLNSKYEGHKHKLKHATNSNSEDALTWSCFDYLRNQSTKDQQLAIQKIIEDAFAGESEIQNSRLGKFEIDIGREFVGPTTNGKTEVDASIEAASFIIFFEAKLYSALSLAKPPKKLHDQIARKLRVGLDYASDKNKEFFLIILDIAPVNKMIKREPKASASGGSSGFHDKWKTAWWFNYYKKGRNGSLRPLWKLLHDLGLDTERYSAERVATNMGWLVWADLFKITLRTSIGKY